MIFKVELLRIVVASLMNSASQDFPRHLGELRQRMLHPTDFEKAVYYFLEEFAGDSAFIRLPRGSTLLTML